MIVDRTIIKLNNFLTGSKSLYPVGRYNRFLVLEWSTETRSNFLNLNCSIETFRKKNPINFWVECFES